MAIQFNHKPRGSVIGSGPYVFRHFGNETPPAPTVDYLCFTAEQANSSVMMRKESGAYDNPLKYSTDGMNWTDVSFTNRVNLTNIGDKVYFKGNGGKLSKDAYGYYWFDIGGAVAVSGNIMTLIDETGESTEISYPYTFYNLFNYASSITTAPSLPATILASHCYDKMFAYCSGLTVMPDLPALTLAEYCYKSMFLSCTRLVTPSSLPAMTLAPHCYDSMFASCFAFLNPPILPATQLVDQCYNGMFWNLSQIADLYLGCTQSVGQVNGAPWGATGATIHYDWRPTA